MTPYEKRQKAANIGDRGRRSEALTAKRLGARLVPMSGALPGHKGDMTLDEFLVEAKSTNAYSMALKLSWLVKIAGEARNKGKKPALTVTFTHDNGVPVDDGKWVMLPEALFKELVGE